MFKNTSIAGITLLAALVVNVAQAQQSLGVPQVNSVQSGVGLIRGWACDANEIELVIDFNTRYTAVYGNPRTDTQGVCGDTDNGFELLINWNSLPAGEHNIQALADGVKFADVNFNTANLGLGDFPRGLNRKHIIGDFPEAGYRTRIEWSEADQNFKFTNSVKEGIPSRFSQGWLSGLTLYNAFYGGGTDENGNSISGDVPVAYSYSFAANGTASVTPLVNGGNPSELITINYSVDSNGILILGDDPDRQRLEICETGSNYLKAHYFLNGELDNVDLFFFNRSDALSATKFFGARVPECSQ